LSISSEVRTAGPYTPNGVTTVFPFSFALLEEDDLLVISSEDGIETELTSGFSVTLNANQSTNPGGSVTFVTAPAVGPQLILSSQVPYTQTLSLSQGGPFSPSVLTGALDRIVILIQQVKDLASRALYLPVSASSGVSTELPIPEAQKLIGWNEAETGLQNFDSSTLATLVAYGTAVADTFVGDGSTVNFTLASNPVAIANLDVSIGGVVQVPTTDYTISGTTLTFTTAPPDDIVILARYMQALPQSSADAASTAFIQAGTGATSRFIQDKAREMVSVLDFGADRLGVLNSTTAFSNALATGRSVYVPDGTYQITGGVLTMSAAGQMLIGSGRGNTFLLKAGNGALLTLAANYQSVTDINISNDVSSTYTGANISATVSVQGLVLERVNSFRCLSNNIRFEQSGHFMIRDCYIDNAPASAGTPPIYIGQSGLGTYAGLYGTIDNCRVQPSGNPVQFDAMGGCKIISSQIGGWDNNVATGSSTVNAVIGCRITGPVSVEGSDHSLIGNAIGAYAVTFETGSSGCWYLGNGRDGAATVTNNGTTNNILDRDSNGLPNFLGNFRCNNGVGIRFYDTAGTNYGLVSMTVANNLSIGNNNGSTQVYANSTNKVQLINDGTSRFEVRGGGQMHFVPLAADPVLDVADGNLYYNSATGKFRGRAAGAWVDLH